MHRQAFDIGFDILGIRQIKPLRERKIKHDIFFEIARVGTKGRAHPTPLPRLTILLQGTVCSLHHHRGILQHPD